MKVQIKGDCFTCIKYIMSCYGFRFVGYTSAPMLQCKNLHFMDADHNIVDLQNWANYIVPAGRQFETLVLVCEDEIEDQLGIRLRKIKIQ